MQQNVRIDNAIISKVKKNKKKTGISIGKFFELAAIEKLANDKKPLVVEVYDRYYDRSKEKIN